VKKSALEALSELVGELLAAVARAITESGGVANAESMLREWYAGSWTERDPAVERVANKILETLGQKGSFEGPEEVTAFVLGRLGQVVHEKNDGEAHRVLAGALMQPYPAWEFEVNVPADTSFLEVGIKFSTPWWADVTFSPGEGYTVVLSGKVLAPTREGAVRKTEHVLDAVLGTARVLDLATFTKSRSSLSDNYMNVLINGEPARLASVYADRIGGYKFTTPKGISEIEAKQKSKGEGENAIARHARLFLKVFGGDSERAREIRAACRLAMHSEDAFDFGMLVILAFSCLEGVLLQKESKPDVTARLAEAVAYSLGDTFESVERLRKRVKDLYDVRSQFAHTGEAFEKPGARGEVLRLLFSVLAKQIERLPQPAEEPARPSA
jgi:hypothetical protein